MAPAEIAKVVRFLVSDTANPGSVARDLLQRADRPVVIVPKGAVDVDHLGVLQLQPQSLDLGLQIFQVLAILF